MIINGTLNHPVYQPPAGTTMLTSLVLQYAPAQAVFLLGSEQSFRKVTSIFSFHSPGESHISHYYILVLIQKEEEHSLNSVQDKIENNLQHFIPTTAIVLNTSAFLAWLGKGHPFAVNVLNKGERLYQSETITFPIPMPVDEHEVKRSNKVLYKQSLIKIEGFLASADLHRLRQDYRLSAFMLHQAAEQALRAMLIINTGLKLNTHSIDKLTRYCSMFCNQLPDIFPKNNEKQKRLYTLLNKAYVDTRYKDDFSISGEELTAIAEKVKAIKELFVNY